MAELWPLKVHSEGAACWMGASNSPGNSALDALAQVARLNRTRERAFHGSTTRLKALFSGRSQQALRRVEHARSVVAELTLCLG